MVEELYERYKDALRTGHVAVLRGRLADALVAYREAAGIAPERALPHTSLGGVLLRLGHVDEALFEYDIALRHAPRDEAVLLGRADALVAAGRLAEAALSLDGVAEVQELSGRGPEAADSLRRAVDLDDTPERRSRLSILADRLRPNPAERDATESLGEALRTLEPAIEPEAGMAGARGRPASDDHDQVGEAATRPAAASDAAEEALALEAGAGEPESIPPDLDALDEAAESALEHGDVAAAREALIALARARGEAGLPDAALDAAHAALSIAPGDAGLHLALVDLYLVHGWRKLAAEKLGLLGRLAELSGDEAAVAEVAAAQRRALAEEEERRAAPFA